AGLAAAHEAGLVHRDVKPDNILIGSDRVRVVDFGIALDREAPDGTRAGTPSYMAPEVLAGERATEASDQYSLGVTFFEALYGKRPGAADEAPPASWERAVIARAMADAPADRFPSLDALIAELDRDRRRRRRALAIAVPTVIAAGAIATIALRSHAAT